MWIRTFSFPYVCMSYCYIQHRYLCLYSRSEWFIFFSHRSNSPIPSELTVSKEKWNKKLITTKSCVLLLFCWFSGNNSQCSSRLTAREIVHRASSIWPQYPPWFPFSPFSTPSLTRYHKIAYTRTSINGVAFQDIFLT